MEVVRRESKNKEEALAAILAELNVNSNEVYFAISENVGSFGKVKYLVSVVTKYDVKDFIRDYLNNFLEYLDIKNVDIKEYENSMKLQEENEYNKILKNSKILIHEKPEFEVQKYYNANTQNAVEIDTYITNPNARHAGLARILVYEGIKKQINKHFENKENKEIYLCSTLHRENLSSKYVSEFFGLKDNLYVKRRDGRDRQVHICKIEKENVKKYLNEMQDKLIVLYNYNPENKKLSQKRKEYIINKQIEYEKDELNKIQGFSKNKNNKYFGNIKDTESKMRKINRLNKMLENIKNKEELER